MGEGFTGLSSGAGARPWAGKLEKREPSRGLVGIGVGTKDRPICCLISSTSTICGRRVGRMDGGIRRGCETIAGNAAKLGISSSSSVWVSRTGAG